MMRAENEWFQEGITKGNSLVYPKENTHTQSQLHQVMKS